MLIFLQVDPRVKYTSHMTWNATDSYNDLPGLPPVHEIETKITLRKAAQARASLAALDQAARRIPNPHVLIHSLSLLEAKASSEIENIVTTNDELFLNSYDPTENASPQVKETLRYQEALFAGVASLKTRPLSISTAIDLCSRIKHREMNVRDLPGTVIKNQTTDSIVYTPPVGDHIIRDLLTNWEQFIHGGDDIEPLIMMAVAHYQFEAIHPFSDGNGRTGRLLNILFLMSQGLLAQPLLYLSSYIIQHKDTYYERLLAVTSVQDWEGWILFMLDAVDVTAQGTIKKIDAIKVEQDHMLDALRTVPGIKGNSDLLQLLFEKPYCRISDVIERCQVSRPTATKWLDSLVEVDKLRDFKRGRERVFINAGFLKALAGIEIKR